MSSFIERRKDSRLPYYHKVVLTDGVKTMVGSAMNISRGGLFITSLSPFPIDTRAHAIFLLPNHPETLQVKVKIAHVVFDRFRAEVECGMGCEFFDVDASARTLINLHILSAQETYAQLQRLLAEPQPNFPAIQACLQKVPHLDGSDLAELRYRVNRICTIFEPPKSAFAAA